MLGMLGMGNKMSLYDTVVIGIGLAGLTTAHFLKDKGQRVMLIGHGVGALVLGSGCIDVLGYQPISSIEPVRDWSDKLSSFMADHPQHPYSLLGETKINEALHAFQGLTGVASLEYQQNGPENWLVPSAAGAIHPNDGFDYAFKNGADFACVGMFDFQVAEDVAIANKVLTRHQDRTTRAWHA